MPKFMPQILPDDEIAEGMNSFNSKQREVFNAIHAWPIEYAKYGRHDVEPVHIFLPGSGEKGKSYLMKVIYDTISKILLYLFKDPEKPGVFLLGPNGITAVI